MLPCAACAHVTPCVRCAPTTLCGLSVCHHMCPLSICPPCVACAHVTTCSPISLRMSPCVSCAHVTPCDCCAPATTSGMCVRHHTCPVGASVTLCGLCACHQLCPCLVCVPHCMACPHVTPCVSMWACHPACLARMSWHAPLLAYVTLRGLCACHQLCRTSVRLPPCSACAYVTPCVRSAPTTLRGLCVCRHVCPLTDPPLWLVRMSPRAPPF